MPRCQFILIERSSRGVIIYINSFQVIFCIEIGGSEYCFSDRMWSPYPTSPAPLDYIYLDIFDPGPLIQYNACRVFPHLLIVLLILNHCHQGAFVTVI